MEANSRTTMPEGVQTNMKASPCIVLQLNNTVTNDPCAICGNRTDPAGGLDAFLEGGGLVRIPCIRKHDPYLEPFIGLHPDKLPPNCELVTDVVVCSRLIIEPSPPFFGTTVYRILYDGTDFTIMQTEDGQTILVDPDRVASGDRRSVDWAKGQLRDTWKFQELCRQRSNSKHDEIPF